MSNTANNAVEILLSVIEHIDTRSKAYAIRSFVGSLNGSAVGYANRIIRSQRPNEGGGIDEFSRILDQADGNTPAGLEPAKDPQDTLSALVSIKQDLINSSNLPEEVIKQIDSPEGTVDFMINREPMQTAATAAMAEAIGVTEEELAQAYQEQYARDRQQLIDQRDDIIDAIHGAPYVSDGFEQLDARAKQKVIDSARRVVTRQNQNTMRLVIGGRADLAGDIALYKNALVELTECENRLAETDPEFAMMLTEGAA